MPEPQKDNFLAMADRLLLRRDPAARPLLSLRLEVYSPAGYSDSFVSSLLAKACSFGLRHLSIEFNMWVRLLSLLRAIFAIESLESLSIKEIIGFIPPCYKESKNKFVLPSASSLTRLTTLSLGLHEVDFVQFHRLISELPSLQDLSVQVCIMENLVIVSPTIIKLKLVIRPSYLPLGIVMLGLPSLELLHVENDDIFLTQFQGEIPLLRKAVVNLDYLQKKDCLAVTGFLNYISHVQELALHIKESEFENYPFPILLEPGKAAPDFPNLKHLEATMCFHEHHYQDIVSMLHHSPVLETLKLVHETPCSDTFGANLRKRKQWASKLTQNADGNNQYVYFKNLHLGENSRQFEKLLNKKSTPKSM